MGGFFRREMVQCSPMQLAGKLTGLSRVHVSRVLVFNLLGAAAWSWIRGRIHGIIPYSYSRAFTYLSA
jgi:hypothetical protein